MSQHDESRQLSLIDGPDCIEESAQLYQFPGQSNDKRSIEDWLDAIAQTPVGIRAIVQKSCDLVDQAFSQKGEIFDSPEMVKKAIKARIGHLEHEVFGVIFLDNKHREIDFKIMFNGTIDGAAVYTREVVKATLEMNAASLLVFHNHPSLDPHPSAADINLTRKLKDAIGLIDVRLLDHIIVGAGKPCSLAEEGHI